MDTGPGQSTAPEPAAPIAARPAPALGRAVFRGSAWMMVIATMSRGMSFIAQIVLGWLLSQNDFGVYALAISAASVASALRDGGVKQLLVQRQHDYDALIGPVYWMVFAFNMATACLVAGLGPPLARIYGEPMIVWLMLGVALSQPITSPGVILITRLQMQMRFRAISAIQATSALVRYGGAIACAALGAGPLSFVIPLPIIAVIEGVMAWRFTREQPWSHPPRLAVWWPLFLETIWLTVGNLAYAVLLMGASPVLGLFADRTAVVGVYFFAFQIVAQVGSLLGSTLGQVLFAAFARIAGEAERKRLALARSIRQTMLLVAPACLGLAVTFPPLELLIWRGKWSSAAEAVQIIGLLYPPAVAAHVALASMQARGMFRQWAVSLIVMALACLGGAVYGSALYGTPVAVALCSGITTAAASLACVLWSQRAVGLGWAASLGTLLPAWLLGAAAAALADQIDRTYLSAAHPIPRLLAAGLGFSVLYGLLTRLLIPSHLRETIAILPARIRGPAGRLLQLPADAE
jgi:O-antigen/teichoic acid export membrane protein